MLSHQHHTQNLKSSSLYTAAARAVQNTTSNKRYLVSYSKQLFSTNQNLPAILSCGPIRNGPRAPGSHSLPLGWTSQLRYLCPSLALLTFSRNSKDREREQVTISCSIFALSYIAQALILIRLFPFLCFW